MSLTPEEGNFFRTKKRQVTDTYNLGEAQLKFQKDTAGQQFGRAKTDLARKFDQMRDKMPWGHAKRGTMNSGLWGLDLGQYGKERGSAQSNLGATYQEQLGAMNLAGQQMAAVKAGGLLDLDEAEQARLAMAAIANTIRGATG